MTTTSLPQTASEPEQSEAVTVVVTRLVKRGREADYERWLEALIRDAATLPGYLGTNVHRPSPAKPTEYTSVFRFDSVANLRAFEESDLRRRALAEVVELVEADAVWQKLSGLEFWFGVDVPIGTRSDLSQADPPFGGSARHDGFTPPPGTVVPQPSRLRMAIVMIGVVYGLVLSIGKLVGLALADAPMPLRLLVTITIEVFFMTYWLMPRLTRWLAWWIYPKPAR